LSSPCIPSLVLCITCLVPALYPLLSCIPCLGSAPQYILCACSVHSFPVCITSTSIPASLRCTCFNIARQILSTPCRHSGQTPHRPRRTLRPTDRNSSAGNFHVKICKRPGTAHQDWIGLELVQSRFFPASFKSCSLEPCIYNYDSINCTVYALLILILLL
jgi:hypothetical protein